MSDTLATLDAAQLSASEVSTAREYAKAATSQATRRAYASDWAAWSKWADAHGMPALPCNPEHLAIWLSSLAEDHKPSSISRALASVSAAHRAAGAESPRGSAAVRSVIAGIRRTVGVKQSQAIPVTPEHLRASVATASPRDRALLLIGFASACRRSELAALVCSDLTWSTEGLAITLQRSKTDQEAIGRVVGIPRGIATEAMEQWLAGRTEGPVFGIGVIQMGRVIKAVLGSAYSMHGLRSGFVTAAALAGKSDLDIQRQTGHRSLQMLARYHRPALWDSNPAKGIL